jgi:hypothetical protein
MDDFRPHAAGLEIPPDRGLRPEPTRSRK